MPFWAGWHLDFTVFGEGEPPEQRPWLPAEPFGVVDKGGPLRGVLEEWRTARLRRLGCDAVIGSRLCDVGVVRVCQGWPG